MFSLTIAFGQQGTWQLMYREQEKADEAFAYCQITTANETEQIALTDDFGQRMMIKRCDITASMLEDLSRSKLAYVERALHQARVQAEAMTMAESDSTLRGIRARQGVSILSPMGVPANGPFTR